MIRTILARTVLLAVTSCCLMIPAQSVYADEAVQLTVPAEIHAVEGIETGIFFENVMRADSPTKHQFEVGCKFGKMTGTRWVFTPCKENVGKHQIAITVKDASGNVVEQHSTKLIVLPANAGKNKKIRVLIIGDSLTGATHYPNEIGRLLSLPGNPNWEMFGTIKANWALPGVVHEGHGGWTWKRFITYYVEDEPGVRRKGTSPFVSPSSEGKPQLNVPQYFEEHCGGHQPDFITISLGINDCFHAPYDNQAAIDKKINDMFKQADIFITALRKAAPNAEIGLCLTTPANSRDFAFDANYKGKYTRQGWKKIQHQLVQQQLKHFANSKDSKLTIIPTGLYLDTTAGYPQKNAVHPNEKGYQQIGSTIYAWMKSKIAE